MSTKRILATGAGGQLAQCLHNLAKETSHELIFYTKDELNICNSEKTAAVIKEVQPHIIINTAAYTQVDRAEEEEQKAFSINAEAVKILADCCKKQQVGLIHISTDYVFDGKRNTAYTETDETAPRTVYGASKLKGEAFIKASRLEHYYIIRTSWLYSNEGHNFYKTMLRLADERDSLRVVHDQYGCPTNGYDLARSLLKIIDLQPPSGIYHYCNKQRTTWFDFACEIMKYAEKDIEVHPVSSSEFPSAATRPQYSEMNCTKMENALGSKIPNWKESLKTLMTAG